MAVDDREEGAADKDPAVLLQQLEKKIKVNKVLMLVALVLSGLVITVAGTGMTVLSMKVSDLEQASKPDSDDPIDDQFVALEQQLILLADFRKSELKKIAAYTKQLEKIGVDCSLEKAAPYQKFLSNREQDFQQLVTTIKSGTADLAAMSQGSKKWLDLHNQTLEDLKDSSVERKAMLDKVLESENNDS